MHQYKGLIFRNEGQKTVEIDIEGTIGGDWWSDDPEYSKNTKEKMKAELKRISNLKAETIIVNINSYGGDVNHGLSIHDLLSEHKAKIITKINGMTASAATIISMAGDERLISDNSLFLAHRASTFGWGNINDINSLANDLNKVDDRIINIYTKVTGKTKEEMQEVMNRNNGYGEWITPEEAKELGFVTEIFEPRKMAAQFSNDILSRFHLPEIPENILIAKTSVEEISLFQKIMAKLENIVPNFSNQNKNHMNKELSFLNQLLNIEGLESADGVNFNLTLQNLQAINEKLSEIDNAVKAKESAEAAQKASETNLANAIDKINEIDETVAAADDVDKKVVAIKAKLAEKPAVQPAGAQADKDKAGVDANGVAWDTIDELEHNKEID